MNHITKSKMKYIYVIEKQSLRFYYSKAENAVRSLWNEFGGVSDHDGQVRFTRDALALLRRHHTHCIRPSLTAATLTKAVVK